MSFIGNLFPHDRRAEIGAQWTSTDNHRRLPPRWLAVGGLIVGQMLILAVFLAVLIECILRH